MDSGLGTQSLLETVLHAHSVETNSNKKIKHEVSAPSTESRNQQEETTNLQTYNCQDV